MVKITHQLKQHKIEREVNDSTPLGLFASNKIGGLFFYDANEDKTQYYASVGGKPFKLIHGMSSDSALTGVHNGFHSFKIQREDHEHEFFVPFYMNALMINTKKDLFYHIDLHPSFVGQNEDMKHKAYEKEGRVVIKSQPQSKDSAMASVYTAVQGNDLKCEFKKKGDKGERYSLGIISDKIVLAVSDNEQEAIQTANHLFNNENKIKGMQENYMLPSLVFGDPEKSLAYACVLNGTDHMFLQDKDKKTMIPVPYFSDVSHPHSSLAASALLSEGEFGAVKHTLMKELDLPNIEKFHEAAWPIVMLGKLLDHLCAEKKLYNYFSSEDIKEIASHVAYLTNLAEQHHFRGEMKKNIKLESQALMMLMYNLAYSLTKIEKYKEGEEDLKLEALKTVVKLRKRVEDRVSQEDVKSLFLASYIYPALMDPEDWKEEFDIVLREIHDDFRTLYSKMVSPIAHQELELELFGLMSLAAVVLDRVDSEHYKEHISKILDSSIKEVLYKGFIGRPSSSFSKDADPEKGLLVKNIHLANNALFLEMLRECD